MNKNRAGPLQSNLGYNSCVVTSPPGDSHKDGKKPAYVEELLERSQSTAGRHLSVWPVGCWERGWASCAGGVRGSTGELSRALRFQSFRRGEPVRPSQPLLPKPSGQFALTNIAITPLRNRPFSSARR